MGLGAYEAGYYMGIPIEKVWDPQSEGWIVAKQVVNQADAAIARAQAKIKDPEPGAQWQVFDIRENPEYADLAD